MNFLSLKNESPGVRVFVLDNDAEIRRGYRIHYRGSHFYMIVTTFPILSLKQPLLGIPFFTYKREMTAYSPPRIGILPSPKVNLSLFLHPTRLVPLFYTIFT